MAKEIDLGIEGIGPATILGRGGSAYVYLAEQVDFGRQVAVKVLFNALEDDATYRRFDRECRAIGAVSSHPNIVVVHGRGLTADERPYLIMEHRAGGSLAESLATRGRFTEAEVIKIGIKIGTALNLAHEAGVLHRDVKPANILLSSFNEPALADFGIARIDGAHKTTEGIFSASVAHASREVLDNGEPTKQSDIYALGSSMFELATGGPAFSRPDDVSIWAVINRVLGEDPPDPRLSGVSDELSQVLSKAMSHDPSQRHRSAAELVLDLQRLQSGNGVANQDTQPLPEVSASTSTATLQPLPISAPRPASASTSTGPRSAKPGAIGAPTTRASAGSRSANGDDVASISRSGVLLSVAVIVLATATATGIALRSTIGSGTSSETDLAPTVAESTMPQPDPLAASTIAESLNDSRTGTLADSELDPGSDSRAGTGTGTGESPTDEESRETQDQPEPVAGGGPLQPLVLNFPRAEVGPLRIGEPYIVQVEGGLSEANYRIVVDNEPVTEARATPPPYFPRAGRHQLQVQAISDTRVQLSNVIEIYVAHRPPESGFRANLSSIRSEPENWPEALRQLDQMVADGHDDLKLSVSNRNEANQLRPYWNYYVDGFGDDKAAAQRYCDERELDRDQCLVAEI
ncbi:MAG: serine/threonine protein kinase [Acidimicrobiales bacterium]